jgi:hypothetical protein
LNQINDQDDDRDYEQEMDQTAADMTEQAKEPKYEQDDNDCPQHGIIPFRLIRVDRYLFRGRFLRQAFSERASKISRWE